MLAAPHAHDDAVCDLCRSRALEPIYVPQGSTRGLSVLLCTYCGLVQSWPRADRAVRARAAVSAGADWGNVRYGKSFRAKAAIEAFARHCDSHAALDVLDVGASRGAFARAFLEIAPNGRLTALEPDERVADSCAGLARTTLVTKRIEDTAFAGESFDAVHSCHTIEHLASPMATLADHWRLLKPGGILILDAPNIAVIGSSDIVEEWFIDKHLTHFSTVTLRAMLTASGFTPIAGPEPHDKTNLLFVARKRDVAARPVRHDPREAEWAAAHVAGYEAMRTSNLGALKTVARELHGLGARKLAIWGAGRLFDSLVVHGGFDPAMLALLVDAHLKDHMRDRHGVALAAPEAIAACNPGIIVVMSRDFASEIAARARALAPRAEIILYTELLASAQRRAAA